MSCAAQVSVGYSRISGFSRYGYSLRRHPACVVQQRRARVGVWFVDLPALDLVLEIPSHRLQEHRVRPAPLRVEQLVRGDVVARMDAAPDQLFGLRQEARLARSAGVRPASAMIEWPAPRPGPW